MTQTVKSSQVFKPSYVYNIEMLVSSTTGHEETIKYLNQPILWLKYRESKASENGDGIFYCKRWKKNSITAFE